MFGFFSIVVNASLTHVGGFPAGQYAYPFQYHLPDELPGVFRKKKAGKYSYNVKIEYKVKAIVDVPGARKFLLDSVLITV